MSSIKTLHNIYEFVDCLLYLKNPETFEFSRGSNGWSKLSKRCANLCGFPKDNPFATKIENIIFYLTDYKNDIQDETLKIEIDKIVECLECENVKFEYNLPEKFVNLHLKLKLKY